MTPKPRSRMGYTRNAGRAVGDLDNIENHEVDETYRLA